MDLCIKKMIVSLDIIFFKEFKNILESMSLEECFLGSVESFGVTGGKSL